HPESRSRIFRATGERWARAVVLPRTLQAEPSLNRNRRDLTPAASRRKASVPKTIGLAAAIESIEGWFEVEALRNEESRSPQHKTETLRRCPDRTRETASKLKRPRHAEKCGAP